MNKKGKMLNLVALVVVIASLVFMTGGSVLAQAPTGEIPEGLKIGYFVSHNEQRVPSSPCHLGPEVRQGAIRRGCARYLMVSQMLP